MTRVDAARRSRHTYLFVWRGSVLGWRSHTKPYLTRAERVAARKAQRRARRAGR